MAERTGEADTVCMGRFRLNIAFANIVFANIAFANIVFALSPFIIASSVSSATDGASLSNYRLGSDSKRTSVTLLAGASLMSGDRSGLGANGFATNYGSDSLYDSPAHVILEYGEHTRHTSLTFGIEYTQLTATKTLRTALGLAPEAPLTIAYFDAPITYQLNAFPASDAPFNLYAGLSLIPMLDIASSTELIFESGASSTGGTTGATTGSVGGLTNKHVDFGLGLGGEIGIEKRLVGNVFLTGRAGFRHPFTGVTRPDFGFFLTGIRIYQQ